jgi:hypothetical protein
VLPLPERGIRRSVSVHNVKLDIFCDWIELTVLVNESEVSRADVIDHLMEQHIYDESDFAAELVGSAWTELRRRHRWLGGSCGLKFEGHRISRLGEWADHAALTFCVLISLAPRYAEWTKHFGSDYTDQGELFERLSIAALGPRFGGWTFQSTGWSTNTTVALQDVVPDLASNLFEEPGNVAKWASGQAHEAGLDLAWYLPFSDLRSGLPIYLGQCASGDNWTKKIHTPELPLWGKLIDFTHPPAKALIIPFALTDEIFQQRRVQVNGLLIDRHRLLPGAVEQDWLAHDLQADLVEWTTPRLDWLSSKDVVGATI